MTYNLSPKIAKQFFCDFTFRKNFYFIAIFGHMSLILFNSKIRISIFSIKNNTKNTDNMFAYTFNNICANFAHENSVTLPQPGFSHLGHNAESLRASSSASP
jgi:hypothetical protein